jgi:hypothetical protein
MRTGSVPCSSRCPRNHSATQSSSPKGVLPRGLSGS